MRTRLWATGAPYILARARKLHAEKIRRNIPEKLEPDRALTTEIFCPEGEEIQKLFVFESGESVVLLSQSGVSVSDRETQKHRNNQQADQDPGQWRNRQVLTARRRHPECRRGLAESARGVESDNPDHPKLVRGEAGEPRRRQVASQ